MIRSYTSAAGLLPLVLLLVASFACNQAEDKGPVSPADTLRREFEAASEGPVELVTRKGLARTLRAVIPTTGSSAEQRARSFLDRFSTAFGLGDVEADLALIQETPLPGSGTVVIFGRQQDQRPVFGSEVRLTLDLQGAVVYVSALLPSSVKPADEATVSAEDAGARAVAHLASRGAAGATVNASQLGLFDPGLLTGEEQQVRLAWLLRLEGDGPLLPAVALVDATVGEVLLSYDSNDRALQRNVYQVQGTSDQPRAIIEGQRQLLFQEGDPPPSGTGSPQLLVDYQMYEHAGRVYSYLYDTFGWDSWDGKGAPIDLYLRYGGPTSWMFDAVFLNKDGESFDSVAHELGHGWTNTALQGDPHTALSKLYEPGALKESLSDLLAVFASFSAAAIEGDWLITDAQGRVDRDLKQITYPTIARYDERKRVPAGADPWDHDKGYVHYNSAIPSLAAYLLVEGGANPKTLGGPVVIGIGQQKVEQIYFRAVRFYLQHTGNFEDARYALLRACTDLAYRTSDNFGIEVRDCGSLLNAWAAVGVGEWDTDRDTWTDAIDNCPELFNPGQEDVDGNRVGDLCEPRETPDVLACPINLTINRVTWDLDPAYFNEQGVPRYSSGIMTNDAGQTILQCPHFSPENKTQLIRINYVLTRPEDPASVPSCSALDQGGLRIDLQSETHSVGANWTILNGLKQTDPEYIVYEDTVRGFVSAGLPQLEPFAATCNFYR